MLLNKLFIILIVCIFNVYATDLSDYWRAFDNLRDCLLTLNITYQLGVSLDGLLVLLPLNLFDRDTVFEDHRRCLGRHNTTLIVYGSYSNNTEIEGLTCNTNRLDGVSPLSDPVIPSSGLTRKRFKRKFRIGPGETLLDAVFFVDNNSCGDGDNEHMILNQEGNCYRFENPDAKLISSHNPQDQDMLLHTWPHHQCKNGDDHDIIIEPEEERCHKYATKSFKVWIH